MSDAHVRGWQVAYRGLVPDAILDGFSVERRTAWRLQQLTTRVDDAPERTWVVETDDGRVQGFADTGPARDESAPPPDGAGEIYAIYLRPEARGRGLGRTLFAHAVDDLVGDDEPRRRPARGLQLRRELHGGSVPDRRRAGE